MEIICLICHEGSTDDERLIKLHENFDHHGHLSCLNTYYRQFQSLGCPLCSKSLDGGAEKLFDLCLSLERASVLDRLDLFEKRLAKLAEGNYRYKPCPPKLVERIMPKLWKENWRYENYIYELRYAIQSTVKRNQVNFLKILLNHISNSGVKCQLVYDYKMALSKRPRTYAKMILETVLKNQTALAGNRLFEFLRAAMGYREMESASLILQKGIGGEFRREVIFNLPHLFHFVNPDTNEQLYECIGEWSPEVLDYGLKCAARDANLKCCNFLISKGASIKRAGVSRILLKRCIDQDRQDLLPCFDAVNVEYAMSRKGKWIEKAKFRIDMELLSLRLK